MRHLSKSMSKPLWFSLCLLMIIPISFAQDEKSIQESSLAAEISNGMQKKRQSPDDLETTIISKERLRQEDPNEVLLLLKPYLNNSEPNNVRRTAIEYLAKITDLHPRPDIRQGVVEILTSNMDDPDLRTVCISILKKRFISSDFNKQSRDYIKRRFNTLPDSMTNISLCGIANIQDTLPQLKELTFDEDDYKKRTDPRSRSVPWYYTTGWQARLARARMGVKADIQRCVKLIEEEIDSNPQFSLSLFRDLGYIRQPQSLESLRKYCLSERKLRPVDGLQASFAAYIWPILCENLLDFPLDKDKDFLGGFVSKDIDIIKLKQWLSEQKEWKIRR